jgi:hypothetical protein
LELAPNDGSAPAIRRAQGDFKSELDAAESKLKQKKGRLA